MHSKVFGYIYFTTGKRLSKLWSGNIGQVICAVLWAVSGRLAITAQNVMFYTVLWCLPNMFFEHAPTWIAVRGIRDIHIKMHRFCGKWFVAIPAVIHVLIVFVPPVVDHTELTYHPPWEFNYSKQFANLNWTR